MGTNWVGRKGRRRWCLWRSLACFGVSGLGLLGAGLGADCSPPGRCPFLEEGWSPRELTVVKTRPHTHPPTARWWVEVPESQLSLTATPWVLWPLVLQSRHVSPTRMALGPVVPRSLAVCLWWARRRVQSHKSSHFPCGWLSQTLYCSLPSEGDRGQQDSEPALTTLLAPCSRHYPLSGPHPFPVNTLLCSREVPSSLKKKPGQAVSLVTVRCY